MNKVLGAAVLEVVAVHAGDHHIAQAQGRNGLGQVGGFGLIEWVWAAVAHVTERAAPGALVTHDHEGGRAIAEALTNVGAGGLLTDGVQLVGAQNRFDLRKAAVR